MSAETVIDLIINGVLDVGIYISVDRVECCGEVQGKHTDEWKHGQHGEDCVEESNESSVCRTQVHEHEIYIFAIYRGS